MARETFKGVPEREIARMGPEVLAGILPRIYPEMLDEVHRHQDEGRATFIVSAAGNEMVAELAQVLRMDGGIGTSYAVGPDGRYTGKLDGPFVYGKGKVEAMRALRRRARHRPRRLLRLLGLRLSDLPMLRARRQPGRRQPRRRPARGRQGGGLAGDALREARPQARDRRRDRARPRRPAARSRALIARRRQGRRAAQRMRQPLSRWSASP